MDAKKAGPPSPGRTAATSTLLSAFPNKTSFRCSAQVVMETANSATEQLTETHPLCGCQTLGLASDRRMSRLERTPALPFWQTAPCGCGAQTRTARAATE